MPLRVTLNDMHYTQERDSSTTTRPLHRNHACHSVYFVDILVKSSVKINKPFIEIWNCGMGLLELTVNMKEEGLTGDMWNEVNFPSYYVVILEQNACFLFTSNWNLSQSNLHRHLFQVTQCALRKLGLILINKFERAKIKRKLFDWIVEIEWDSSDWQRSLVTVRILLSSK